MNDTSQLIYFQKHCEAEEVGGRNSEGVTWFMGQKDLIFMIHYLEVGLSF